MAILKYCYRCGGLVDRNHKHRNPRNRNSPNQKAYRGVGDVGRAWRRERAAYLKAFPVCQWPNGCLAPATQVHHADGLGPTGPQGLSWSNFIGMCASHHAQEEASRQLRNERGEFTGKKRASSDVEGPR
jgi:hypothetical protein